jgi:ribosomal protein S18 acetylase RimI-like enzyme
VTAAAQTGLGRRTHDGLRPLNARRDMRSVASVIEAAFSGQLDSAGRRMVRDMKALGRFGWFGWVVAQLILPPAAYPLGFVWEQDGEVVGNVSLLTAEGYPARWILANVAVLPGHRRRGIAHALVSAAIDLAARRGGREAVLQVDVRSQTARHLYEGLGFTTQATRTTWWRPSTGVQPEGETPANIRQRRDEDWPQQYALARSVSPEGLRWPFPLRADVFRPDPFARALGFRRKRHWAWYDDSGKIGAALTAQLGSEARHWRFTLLVSPELQGVAEGPMLAHALRELAFSNLAATVDYPTGLAKQTLSSLGFWPKRALTWMRLDLHGGRPESPGQMHEAAM